MACRTAAILMTLNILEGHLPFATLFEWNFCTTLWLWHSTSCRSIGDSGSGLLFTKRTTWINSNSGDSHYLETFLSDFWVAYRSIVHVWIPLASYAICHFSHILTTFSVFVNTVIDWHFLRYTHIKSAQ